MSDEQKTLGDAPDDPSNEGAESEDRDADAESAAESEASDRAERGEAKSEDEPEAESARAEPKPRPKKKKKKSAPSTSQQIRDRNQRVREQAAARRRTERERSKPAGGLDASELVDDALARSTHAATSWLKQNFNAVQWVLVIVVAGSVAWMIYSWRSDRRAEKSSDALMLGVRAQQGRVGDAPADPDSQTGLDDVREHFATDEARLKAAETEYRKAIDVGGNSGAATLAKLGLAAVLFQQKKYDEARQTYESVRTSKLAQNDADVRGRALEGIGMAVEAKGDREGALKAFRELQNSDLPGFTPLAMYHQARVLHAMGDDAKAKELIKTATEKAKAGHSPVEPATYVEIALHELLTAIDPIAAAASVPGGMTMDQIERLKAQLSQLQGMGDPKQLDRLLKEMQGGSPVPRPGAPAVPAPSGGP